MKIIYDLFVMLNYTIIFLLLSQTLIKKKFSRTQNIYFIVLGTVITSISLYFFSYTSIKPLALFLSYFILSLFVLKMNLLSSLLTSCLFFILTALCDAVYSFITIFIFKINLLGYNIPLKFNLIFDLLTIAFMYMILFIFNLVSKRFGIIKELFQKNIRFILCLLFAFILVYFDYAYFSKNINIISRNFYIINIILLISFLLLCIIFNLNFYKLIVTENENRELKIYLTTIEGLTQELRKFRHNYINILESIDALVEYEKWDELKEYFKDVLSESNKIKKNDILSLDNIKIISLLGLISTKINKALDLGIEVKVRVASEVSDTVMKQYDLCEIMGIYLDNAIEAASESKDKIIEMFFHTEGNSLYITIKNSFGIKPQTNQLGKRGYSTKGEKRGNGLSYAYDIIYRYKNVLTNTGIESDRFIADICIPIK